MLKCSAIWATPSHNEPDLSDHDVYVWVSNETGAVLLVTGIRRVVPVMSKPLVSIGLPVRDGAEFLSETLESLLDQTVSDFELIISDNASEDDTPRICREFCSRDSRIRYHRFDVNMGAARNYNHVFELARGRFFKWAAHDDLCLSGFLEKCLDEFSRSPAAVLVYPRVELINVEGKVTGKDDPALIVADARAHIRLQNFFQKIRLANPIFGLMRSDSLRQTRLIDAFVSSDVVLLAELLMLGEFREVPEVLFRRRLHKKRSLEANRTQRDLLAWFDPAKRQGSTLVSVPTRLSLEYTRSICRMPIPMWERVRCLGIAARWQWWPVLRGTTDPPFTLESRRLVRAKTRICRLTCADQPFILVDDEQLRVQLGFSQAVPFLERDGKYWGPPADDQTAIRELERLRETGATHIAFTWPAFWWLDHYAHFNRYLQDRYPSVWDDAHLKVYDLKP